MLSKHKCILVEKQTKEVRMKRCICVLLVMLAMTGVAQAGQWYVGADIGAVDHEFTPTYAPCSGIPDVEFKNEDSGYLFGVNGGYMQEVCNIFSIGFQAHVSVNNSEWALNLPDPANFSYEQPYTWGLSVVPVIKLCKKSALVLEAGLIQGSVKEYKYGSLETNYDVSETIGGTLLGAGISYELTDSMDVIVKYQRTDFSSFAYKTISPAGTQVETVWDNPTAVSWSLGIKHSF
jgi:opacity protein-like surface antigen